MTYWSDAPRTSWFADLHDTMTGALGMGVFTAIGLAGLMAIWLLLSERSRALAALAVIALLALGVVATLASRRLATGEDARLREGAPLYYRVPADARDGTDTALDYEVVDAIFWAGVGGFAAASLVMRRARRHSGASRHDG